MAKKKAEAESASPLKSLPIDPKILGGLVLIIIIAAIFMSRSGEKVETPVDTGNGEETPYVPPAPSDETPAAQCTKNTDCNDNNPCTTDSCTEGSCSNTVVAGCELKTGESPKISAANFAVLDDEFVRISGKNIKINGWKITNGKGEVYWQFDPYGYKILNVPITVYSGCGIDTNVAIYKCLDSGFFSDSGDKAILYDENKTVVDEFTQ